MNALNERNVHLHKEDYPLSLSPEQIQDPVQVIRDFYEDYDLMQAKNYFWEWLHYLTSDQARPLAETQTRLRIFGASLLRLIDAAWVTLKHKHPLKFKPLTNVREHIEADRISFITTDEIKKPQKVIRHFFRSIPLRSWYDMLTDNFTRCLNNSRYSINWIPPLYHELGVFYHLFRLLESLSIVAEKTDTPSAYVHWCYKTDKQLVESVKELFIAHPVHTIHESLAGVWNSLYYFKDWHPLLSNRFMADLTIVIQSMHAASQLLVSDDSRMYLKNSTATLAPLWSPYLTTSFVVLLITESPDFRSGWKREPGTPDKIEHMETTLQLLADYLQSLNTESNV